MTEPESRNDGFDEWLDALESGEGYYLECENGHGWLPPRRVCTRCGSTTLEETPLPDAGPVDTFTVVHIPTPSFADDAPYVTAVATFGPVRITGVLRGIDADDVETGLIVEASAEAKETDDDRVVVFRPR